MTPGPTRIPDTTHSLWIDTAAGRRFEPLRGEVEADVAVVGGGIVGVATAHRLKAVGRSVAVVEAGRLLEGTTGHTTAKLTAGHGRIYTYLERQFGRKASRRYAEASEWGIAEVERLSRELNIDCDFERAANVVYSIDPGDIDDLRQEADTARRAGLDAAFTTEIDLPYPVTGAVTVEGEAQFHPRKLLLALADRVTGDGGHVFEASRVTSIRHGDPCEVRTQGGVVRARHVVVATQLPVLYRGLHFARAFPKRHYAIAGPADRMPPGMYISTETPPHSIRTVPADGERLLLVLGESHPTGQEKDTESRFGRVAEWAADRFGLREVRYRWSAQDWYSADRVPLIGPISWWSPRVLAAAGFGGWGMAPGIAASRVLSELILGEESEWASLFSPRRAKLGALPKLGAENAKVGMRWTRDRVPRPARTLADLEPDEGGIVRSGGRRVAAYRDANGTVHAVSPRCTHLGCEVAWNAAERSWDCPCHGSRFGVDGEVLNAPATSPLERVDTDQG
jgi:glycine/D-amino acid oxidase-like deaminating enzyme/nitrite reductase/ring-hydroxylating ferredoxin subunit